MHRRGECQCVHAHAARTCPELAADVIAGAIEVHEPSAKVAETVAAHDYGVTRGS